MKQIPEDYFDQRIHRRVGDAEMRFFHNAKLETRTPRASFRLRDRLPELWQGDTGVIQKTSLLLPQYNH